MNSRDAKKRPTFGRLARYKVGPVTRDFSRVKTPLISGWKKLPVKPMVFSAGPFERIHTAAPIHKYIVINGVYSYQNTALIT